MSEQSNSPTLLEKPRDEALTGSAIQTVLSLCTQCAQRLAEQPLFEGSGSIARQCKVLPLEKWHDARICDILSANAEKLMLREEIWPIHSFGVGNNQLYDASRGLIEQGLELWLGYSQPAPLETLERAYRSVAQALTIGWSLEDPVQYPDIFFKEDPETFDLLLKTRTLTEEDTLIRFICSKFEMDNSLAHCSNLWRLNPGSECRALIYLWVKKTHTKQLIKQLSLQVKGLDEPSESEKDKDVCKHKDEDDKSQTRISDTEEPHAMGDEIQLTFQHNANGQTMLNMLKMWKRDKKLGDARSREHLKRFKREEPSFWLFFQYMRLSKQGKQRHKVFGEQCKTLSTPIVKTGLKRQ